MNNILYFSIIFLEQLECLHSKQTCKDFIQIVNVLLTSDLSVKNLVSLENMLNKTIQICFFPNVDQIKQHDVNLAKVQYGSFQVYLHGERVVIEMEIVHVKLKKKIVISRIAFGEEEITWGNKDFATRIKV